MLVSLLLCCRSSSSCFLTASKSTSLSRDLAKETSLLSFFTLSLLWLRSFLPLFFSFFSFGLERLVSSPDKSLNSSSALLSISLFFHFLDSDSGDEEDTSFFLLLKLFFENNTFR